MLRLQVDQLEMRFAYRSAFTYAVQRNPEGLANVHERGLWRALRSSAERGLLGKCHPIGRRSCYDESKRCAETLFFDFHRQYALDVRVARVSNPYGPRMHPKDGRVVSNFIVQALSGEPVAIYGDGSQTRSFCYVSDLVDALILFMNARPVDPGPLNLGNLGEFTVLELAEMVLRLTNSSSPLVLEPLPEDDPKRRRPDISRAKSLLGWEPRVPLEEGLKETIRYFRKTLSGEMVSELPRHRSA